MIVSQNQIEDKLRELQKACNKYNNIDSFASWVLYAVTIHIRSGKATMEFEYDFVNYPNNKLKKLIKKCLKGDRSHDGIIKTVKKIITV